ncbi:Dimethylaniline monooxygenase N-oxide-forming [Penicillium cf. griseofulvum]|uniref:Dimethylaniline monooxygenase N-oxide-forming n=1 Tax=Penicillium cf. griseofulvum TaxID=2972120 RepID=A0A9W9MGC7_9EURO|nr:Dimethylaniline monooxygenase N-oxide-forming [Penicillium cf. griseofulvum]KAJ5431544.1 Dimethylaniline monooxygenase N-oxide-forming [Penicillium cf. griseofulvum]
MSEAARVAVIGAGISGVVTAGHLLAAEIQVTVFERNDAAGGVWLYDKRTPIEVHYPSSKPSASQEYVKDERGENERKILLHAPPGPCYESLTNNVSTPLLETKLNAWPEGTAHFVKHHVLKEYIQDTSTKAGVNDITKYGARVTRVYKDGPTWTVHWSTLSKGQDPVENKESATFDSVIVASGHYHTPLIPEIRGLPEAKARWPERIFHSKSFRRSQGFEGKNILLLGGGVSALDIAKEISGTANHVYQSTRNGAFDLPESALPANASRIAEVEAFEPSTSTTSPNIEPLPLTVHLKSGESLKDIHTIILCTGYQMALPFLEDYNDYGVSAIEASDKVLVTDGTLVHNLHQDIFYIPDPTLAFVGIPFYTATFSLFEFQAIAVAAFLSGVAQLPSTASLRTKYEDRVKEKGLGRNFHSLKDQEQSYVDELIGWVNTGRAERGLSLIEGHTKIWIKERAALGERIKLILAGQLPREDALKAPLEVAVTA